MVTGDCRFFVILIAVYVGSAVVALTGLIDAVRAADGAAVLARTDVQSVRRSLVGQIVGAYLDLLGEKRVVRPIERLLANAYGTNVADALADKLISQENLTRLSKMARCKTLRRKSLFRTYPRSARLIPQKRLISSIVFGP